MIHSTTYADLIHAVHSSGLAGGVIALHSSLKSFGQVDGGAGTVVRAFLEASCTLVVPTFTYGAQVPPPPGWSLAQNGEEGDSSEDAEPVTPFDLSGPVIERSMGAIPAHILSCAGRVRGNHPLNSFAAVGPLAAEIIAAQSLLNVYGPYKQMYARQDAFVLLIGVGLTRTTPVHFAEERAGRRLFRRWAKYADGTVYEVEVGSCSEGFDQLDPAVSQIEHTIQVSGSRWRVFPFRTFVDTVAAAVIQNPAITHCADPACVRCRDMTLGGPLLP